MCVWSSGDIEAVYRFASIGHQILSHFGERSKAVQPRAHVVILCMCYVWKKPLPSLVNILVRAFEEALLADMEMAVSHTHTRGFQPHAASGASPVALYSLRVLLLASSSLACRAISASSSA